MTGHQGVFQHDGYTTATGLATREAFHSHFSSDGPDFRSWARNLLAPHLARAHTIVDVAAGRGSFWGNAFGDPRFDWNNKIIVACDRSHAMVRLLAAVKPERMAVIASDMNALPFRDHSIDVLLCHSALHYADNALVVLQRFQNALSLDGQASIIVSGSGNMRELHRFFEAGGYGIALDQRPLNLFHEPQLDASLTGFGGSIEKSNWESSLFVDSAERVADYFLSHPELSATPKASEIWRDMVDRMRTQLNANGPMLVQRRQCHYLLCPSG